MINHLKEDQFEKLRSAFPVQFSGCAERNAKADRERTGSKRANGLRSAYDFR